jgi:hypothetical protein
MARRKQEEPEYSVDDAWAAIRILARFTPDRIPEARRDYFNAFVGEFDESGIEPPEWIDELRRRVKQAT